MLFVYGYFTIGLLVFIAIELLVIIEDSAQEYWYNAPAFSRLFGVTTFWIFLVAIIVVSIWKEK